MNQTIIDKLLSGKFFMTIVCSLVFAYCSVSKIIESKDIMMIVGIVTACYFSKDNTKPDKPTNDKSEVK